MSGYYVHHGLAADQERFISGFYCLGCGREESIFEYRAMITPHKDRWLTLGRYYHVGYGDLTRFIATCVFCGSSAIFMRQNDRWYRLGPDRLLHRLDTKKRARVRAPNVELPADWVRYVLD